MGKSVLCITFAVLVFITGCKNDDKTWKKAKSQNTKQAYTEYLKQYPDGQFITQAQEAIEEIDWQGMYGETNEEKLLSFIKMYPDGIHVSEAKIQLSEIPLENINNEDVYWERIATNDNIDRYKIYLEKYTYKGKYAQLAIDVIETKEWEDTCEQNISPAYSNFITKYPNSKFIEQAEEAIVKISKPMWDAVCAKDTIEDYREFMCSDKVGGKWKIAAQKHIDDKLNTQTDPEYHAIDLKCSNSGVNSFYRFILSSQGGDLYVKDSPPFYKKPRTLFGGPTMSMLTEKGNEWLIQGSDVKISDVKLESDPDYPLLFKMSGDGLVYVGGRGSARGDTKHEFGNNHTIERFIAQIQSKHSSLRHSAIWGLGYLAVNQEDKKKAADAIIEILGSGDDTLDICALEALYRLAQPNTLKPLLAYRKALLNRSYDNSNMRLSDAVLTAGAGPQVLSPADNYGRGSGPWYMEYVEATIEQVVKYHPDYVWPPRDADKLASEDGQFRRIYVPLTFVNVSNTKGGLSIVNQNDSIIIKTERHGDLIPMSINVSPRSMIPVGVGSEIRFGGTVSNGELAIVVPEGRLAFRKTELGWVYLCGAGRILYDVDKVYEFGQGRTAQNCLENITNSDNILREAAIRELTRVAISDELKPKILDALENLSSEDCEDVRIAANYTREAIEKEK